MSSNRVRMEFMASNAGIEREPRKEADHLPIEAADVARELIRRVNATNTMQAVCNFTEAHCTCPQNHPVNHYAIVMIGPGRSRDDVMDALAQLVEHRAEIEKHDDASKAQRQRGIGAQDITGGGRDGAN